MTAAARVRAQAVFEGASGGLIGGAVVVSAVVLIVSSHPAGPAGLAVVLVPGLGLLAVGCWVGVVIHSLLVRRLPVGVIVAPVLGALVVGLVHTGAASRLRFELLDRASFEAVVAQAPAPAVSLPDRDLTSEESADLEGEYPGTCPSRIGTLFIGRCSSFVAGYLFYDEAGSGLLDDGGVAYLPAGAPQYDVGNGNFESPQFSHLSGPWYAFASSW